MSVSHKRAQIVGKICGEESFMIILKISRFTIMSLHSTSVFPFFSRNAPNIGEKRPKNESGDDNDDNIQENDANTPTKSKRKVSKTLIKLKYTSTAIE